MDTAARLRISGLFCGLLAGIVLMASGLGGFAPPVFVGSLILGVLLGEVTSPRPERTQSGSATLEMRRVRDYVPRPAIRGVVAMAAAIVVTMGAVGLFRLLDLAAGGPYSIGIGWYGAQGGYPEASYGVGGLLVSLAVTVVLTLVLFGLALRVTVGAPQVGANGDQRVRDDAWRRRTATIVTATVGVVLSLTLAIIGFLGTLAFTHFVVAPAALATVALLGFAAYTAMLTKPTSPDMTPAPPTPGADPARLGAGPTEVGR